MTKRVIDYRVDLSNEAPEGKIELLSFTKDMPYFMDLTFYRYGFERMENKLKDIQFIKPIRTF